MAIINALLTNKAYGFPTRGGGNPRRHTPHILGVVHITGNATNQGATAATNERNYANRAGSGGPSAHYYLNRDGSGLRAIDRIKFAAWSNGDVKSPNTANAGVATMLAHRARGFNVNECCWLEIECVGYAKAAGQITAAQMETVAQLLAAEAKRTGLPVNRKTILTHADINSVDRPNCAFLVGTREARMSALIARVRAILTPPVVRDTVTITVTGDRPLTVTKTASLVSVAGHNLVTT